MKHLASFILLFVYLNSNSQKLPERNWVDSELEYKDSNGNLAKFIHSFPRGGGEVYKDGKKYSYVVFWTRVFNQSANDIEINVKFPEVTYFKSPDSYIHIILPKATMSPDKEQVFDYGLTKLQGLFNNESNQLSILQKKINPKEDYTFYTVFFMHIEKDRWGPARAKFELKGQDLFYKISLGSDTTLIPCGNLYFKK
jgi:hypothetical protein